MSRQDDDKFQRDCAAGYTGMTLRNFISKYVEDWSTAVHDTALSAKSNWHEPPGIDEFSAVALPTWTKIGAYIDAGGLEHVDILKDPVATREKGGRTVHRAHRDADSAQLPCLGWASQRGCRFKRKGDPCRYRHDRAGKFQGEKQGGEGASGVAQGRGWHDAGRSRAGRRRGERQEQEWRRCQTVQGRRQTGVRAPPDGGANLGD